MAIGELITPKLFGCVFPAFCGLCQPNSKKAGQYFESGPPFPQATPKQGPVQLA